MSSKLNFTEEEVADLFGSSEPNISKWPHLVTCSNSRIFEAILEIIQVPLGLLGIPVQFEEDGSLTFYGSFDLLSKIDPDLYKTILQNTDKYRNIFREQKKNIDDIADFAVTPFKVWATAKNQSAVKYFINRGDYNDCAYVLLECFKLDVLNKTVYDMILNIRNYVYHQDKYLPDLFEYSDIVIWPIGTDNSMISFVCKPERIGWVQQFKQWCNKNEVKYCTIR